MKNIDDLISFCKRRGFVYPSSEIYGGFAGVYDYGPVGILLKENIKNHWWKKMIMMRRDIVGLDSGIFTHPKVWDASGHTKNFNDPYVVIKSTGEKLRADHLLEEIGVSAENLSEERLKALFKENIDKLAELKGVKKEDFTEPRMFNLLVESNLGVISDKDNIKKTYLRGETCQGIYLNFKNVYETYNVKIPFGIGQVGKAFRNEISPRQFLFRTREFEQMEMQYFTDPKDANKYFEEFKKYRMDSIKELGIDENKLRFKDHDKLVFYAKTAVDIEYKYNFGWKELEGIHNRGDYDLSSHSKASKSKLTYYDDKTKEHITPYIIETSIGLNRLFLAIIENAYTKETLPDGTERVVLKLKEEIAPFKVAILPLMRKPEYTNKAKDIFNQLSPLFSTTYDETQSIGRRYRRQDEIGTPYCITVDEQTLEDNTVTIRERDSMKQGSGRVKISDLKNLVDLF